MDFLLGLMQGKGNLLVGTRDGFIEKIIRAIFGLS
jgi:hypothetical protein